MKKPKISIITVCYNSEAHIEEAILSVINQSYENKEYLVIDGGSKDGTLNIIEKYKDRIDYFVSEPDKGISDAFNKGIKAATGDIIGILNSDDFMMPNALTKVAEHYEERIDVYRGYCLVWNEQLGTKNELHPNMRFKVPPFGAIICHESSFISKKVYDKVGLYKVHFKYMMDLDFFIRMYNDKSIRSKIINVCVITFRTGGASSSSAFKVEQERKLLIKENGGSSMDVLCYVFYHRVKYSIKVVVNTIKSWIKK